MPNTPVCSVRADTPISECVRILRNKNIGALIVLNDSGGEELGGIFTERDLIKNIELIHRGDFWATPVRTVMTHPVRTVTVDELAEAPMIMAKYHIRHLPVVAVEGGKTHVIGVLSMRDIFRMLMESIDYKLEKIFPELTKASAHKSFGIFSQDKALLSLAQKGAKIAQRSVQLLPHFDEFSSSATFLEQFDAILIDLDDLTVEALKRTEVLVADMAKQIAVVLCFRSSEGPAHDSLQVLHGMANVHMLAKPVAFGLLYEQLLKARGAAN